MRTATLNDLQTRLPDVLTWLCGGEGVMVKAEPVAPPAPQVEPRVDWSKSTGFRDRTGETVLTQQDLDELYEDMRGPY